MLPLNTCSLKTALPLLVALFVVAQIDLASAFAWPVGLLSLLHLTPVTDVFCRGVCSGIGASLDVIVIYQFARIWARRAMQVGRDAQPDETRLRTGN